MLKTFKPTIIALAGAQEVGKDTVASLLVRRYGFKQITFVDLLRIEVADNWYSDPDLIFSRSQKDTQSKHLQILFGKNQEFIRWYVETKAFFAEKKQGVRYPLLAWRTPRELMLLWSAWRKSVAGDDVYERDLIERLRNDIEANWVVSDLRLDREHAQLNRHANYFQYHFESWEVTRPGKQYSNRDQYDTRLPDNLIDMVVVNDRGITELVNAVDVSIRPILETPCVMQQLEIIK